MAVLCGWASLGENGKATGGAAGDQKQTSSTKDLNGEVKLGNWYSFGQTEVLRWKTVANRKAYVKAVKYLCNSPLVGYNQSERTTLYTALKAVNWDYTKLKKKVNCDCSELVACAVNCVLKKAAISSAVYTGNLSAALVASGYFNKLTGSKYLTSSDYLRRGDIINAPGHHVISALQKGAKVGVKITPIVPKPTLKLGTTRKTATKRLQRCLNYLGYTDTKGRKLTVDGDFGTSTKQALNKFKKKYGLPTGGTYGRKAYAKMKKLIK